MLTTKPMKKTRVSKRVKIPPPQEESKVVEEKKGDASHPTPKIPKRVKPVRRAEVISKKNVHEQHGLRFDKNDRGKLDCSIEGIVTALLREC